MEPLTGRGLQARRRCVGAVALEYILIVALVAIALIAAFRMWGRVTARAVENASGDVDIDRVLAPEP